MQYERTQAELQEFLREQLQFLEASCRSYDAGFEGEVKRIAVCVRVLVHDTPKSSSLLKLLDGKGVEFLDTSVPYEESNFLSHSSLVGIILGQNRPLPTPLLDDGPFKRLIGFSAWWNGIVFVDNTRGEFSRRDIVLTLANKEGGAHVDKTLDQAYMNLRQMNSLGVFDVTNDGRETPAADQIPAAMRQIGHEVLRTLRADYSCHREMKAGDGVFVFGASMTEGSTLPKVPDHNLPKNRPMVGGKKIGRNDSCYCGSGKKYKKCCINLA